MIALTDVTGEGGRWVGGALRGGGGRDGMSPQQDGSSRKHGVEIDIILGYYFMEMLLEFDKDKVL